MKRRIIGLIALCIVIAFTSGCRQSRIFCDSFSVSKFRNYEVFYGEDLLYGIPFQREDCIQLVKPHSDDKDMPIGLPVYLRVEYLSEGKDESLESETDLENMSGISFTTGDIIWNGIEGYFNYGTILLIGENTNHCEKWRVIANPVNENGKVEFSVADVEKWLRTIKKR